MVPIDSVEGERTAVGISVVARTVAAKVGGANEVGASQVAWLSVVLQWVDFREAWLSAA